MKKKENKKNSLLNIKNNKKGAELVENILMIGIAVALIVVIFYPQIMTIMESRF